MKTYPKTSFKLYQPEDSRTESTVFDLFSGNLEPQQTKGLAIILSTFPQLLFKLLSIGKIRPAIEDVLFNRCLNADNIYIDAEMVSVGCEKLRRDITISFCDDQKKFFIVVIEAKSINIKSCESIEVQLEGYFDIDLFADSAIPHLGIALTQNEIIFEESDFRSITWLDIIQLLESCRIKSELDFLTRDYLSFITGANKNMYYYEKEVLSIPGRYATQIIEDNKLLVYACPSKRSHKRSIYVTFRQVGGWMDKLYKIRDVLVLMPSSQATFERLRENDNPYLKDIEKYLEVTKNLGWADEWKNIEHKFYFLDKNEIVKLPRKKKYRTGLQKHTYFKLSQLFSTEDEYVEIDN